MRFSRLVALVASVACIAGVSPCWRAELVGASRGQNPSTQQPNASAPNFSGAVLQHDGTTPVAGMHLRLRNVVEGPIVGQTVSDMNGAFAFEVSEPGLYVVEAVEGDDVRAVTSPVMFTDTPITTNVIVPELNVRADFFSSSASFRSAVPLLSAASAVGICAWTICQGAALSPER